MKVFLVNLDRNPERLADISRELAELGVEFERVSAVYGRSLGEDEKRRSVARFKWWCLNGTAPRDGEIGCALSHLKTYRRFLETGENCCCVLEDDLLFDRRFKEQLGRIEKWIDPNRAQVVLMTNYSAEKGGDEWRIVRSAGDSSTEAYVITKTAAAELLKRNYPVCTPSDGWRFWAKRGWIELYHAFPTMVPSTWQLGRYSSEVCPDDDKLFRALELGMVGRVLWKIKRAVGVILAALTVR
ncbi:MAG: glycosyltransferase family 25 protein [Kiritimatiellae bacterium]|nr:glycosyltransferase family 25 protein [Kiritimatiellia bacterium]